MKYHRNLFARLLFVVLLTTRTSSPAQVLKSVIYDLDGLDIGQSDLPEGDYSWGDISYQAVANPLPPSDMLGDRVLQVNLNWNTGTGVFGRGISRFIEFDRNNDRLNFFIYNPPTNNQNAELTLTLGDDDNQDNAYDLFVDDCWQRNITVTPSGNWQFISVPLKDLADGNSGGNGVFDMAFTQNKGMLLMAEIRFQRPAGAGNAVFYLDMMHFSEGDLPHGNSIFDLPLKDPSDQCPLGAYMMQPGGQQQNTGPEFESLFPPGKKIKFINYFFAWGVNGSTIPNNLPGNEVQAILAAGYIPIMTWEPLLQGYSRLDPVQPRLQNINNGNYNSYIDAVANQVKTYSGTVIIRLMHEFDGDWYAWSLSQNNHDPSQFVTAFRKVVNRFRALGANNVKWMWCVNSDYAPYEAYNWIVPAYPGDSYVDIVATDIYNSHFPVSVPFWRSFRSQAAESYYYLNKYFPQKPLYICELGCRERLSSENTASESKGAWFERMDKEMQSNYRKARALIFFNAAPDQNWFVNSSPYALQSLTSNVWNDNYYFPEVFGIAPGTTEENAVFVFPNPTDRLVNLNWQLLSSGEKSIRISNCLGEIVYSEELEKNTAYYSKQVDLGGYPKGIYFVEIYSEESGRQGKRRAKKLVLH